MINHPPRFYGLARAKRERWRLMVCPGTPIDILHRFRREGAVIVEMEVAYDSQRHWWFGLPPAKLNVDLRKLAGDAGMLGETPETFRWLGNGAC